MPSGEPIALRRDVDAVAIPSGGKVQLFAGDEVVVTQALGGSFTVTTEHGYMVRIAGKDADALGKEPLDPVVEAAAPQTAAEMEKAVWDQLATCYDPEIPVNVVELGLVYHCGVAESSEGGFDVDVKFTLTAPGCGMADSLRWDMENKVANIPGVKQCQVEVVFEPPWSREMMSEAARLQLGML